MNHPLLLDYTDHKGNDHYYRVMQILEALNDACDEMSYSNYHTDKFRRAQKMIREWAETNLLDLGPTREELKASEDKAYDEISAGLVDHDIKVRLAAIHRMLSIAHED